MTVMTAPLTHIRNARSGGRASAIPTPMARHHLSPLDRDEFTNDVVLTTREAISRVALVAAGVTSRIQCEGIVDDWRTWMLAPRAPFVEENAPDACLGRDACPRGILLLRLSIGFGAQPEVIDAMLEEGNDERTEDDRLGEDASYLSAGASDVDAHMGRPPSDGSSPRLFTATVVACDDGGTTQAFHASLASDRAEIAERLYMRIGAAAAGAVIVEGVNPQEPLVAALVAPAILDALALIAVDPGSPLGAGLHVNVEQRFLG